MRQLRSRQVNSSTSILMEHLEVVITVLRLITTPPQVMTMMPAGIS
jgi:hypothetical protein